MSIFTTDYEFWGYFEHAEAGDHSEHCHEKIRGYFEHFNSKHLTSHILRNGEKCY